MFKYYRVVFEPKNYPYGLPLELEVVARTPKIAARLAQDRLNWLLRGESKDWRGCSVHVMTRQQILESIESNKRWKEWGK